jgi:hypothetical protein
LYCLPNIDSISSWELHSWVAKLTEEKSCVFIRILFMCVSNVVIHWLTMKKLP